MKKNLNAHRRVLDYACEDTKALFDQFQLSGQGYTETQAEESRARYGRNVVAGRAADTVLYRLRRAFINPFTVILFILASISFLTDVVLASNFSRNITTVVIILCMLLISGLVRFVQELRAKHVADHLTGMVATSVLVRRDGRWQNLSSAELAVGDQVCLHAGDRVPADIRLTAANDLFVSQSVITGESAVLEKTPGSFCAGRSIPMGIAATSFSWGPLSSAAAARESCWQWGKIRFTAASPSPRSAARTGLTRGPTPSPGC